MTQRPIFIHALFRTGSTYVWNKFRMLPDHVCYYEPFHQLLTKVTRDNIQDALTRNFKAVGHPDLDRHYLQEYEQLLDPGRTGVPHFRKELSFDWFCQSGADECPDQKEYVDFLIQACGEKVPLFQFNRTALRSAWFKANYPGSLNIYLYRDPRDQWQSYAGIKARTGYDVFFLMDVLALSKNRDHPLVRPLRSELPLLKYCAAEYSEEEALYRILYHAYSEEEKYLIFYYLWLQALLENALHADTMWDINELAANPEYRGRVQQWLGERQAAVPDFADCRITRYSTLPLPLDVMAGIEDLAWELICRSRPQETLQDALGRLPAGIAGRWRGGLESQAQKSAGVRRGDDRAAATERMAKWLMDNWREEIRGDPNLQGGLKDRNESILLIAGLVLQEMGKMARSSPGFPGLGRVQAGIEGLVGLLREERRENEHKIRDLSDAVSLHEEEVRRLLERLKQSELTSGAWKNEAQEKKREVGVLRGLAQEKEREIGVLREKERESSASLALLQSQVRILQHSRSFRLGRAMLAPLRLGKKLLTRFRGKGAASGFSVKRIAAGGSPTPAGDKKISLIDQIHLDFGRHRSGLKYGLQFLLSLHHPQGTVLDAFIERTFSWQPHRTLSYNRPWIGFIHVPPRLPDWFHVEQNNQAIFRSGPWQKSLPWCRGLFTFSRYHQRSLQPLLPIPVDTLLLPTETPALKWSPEKFAANKQKQIVQVGWWLRRLHAIYQLPRTDFAKAFLNVAHPSIPELMKKEKEILMSEGAYSAIDLHSASVIPFLSNREYDLLLSQNIVFLHLYDSSACNAIVECMVRHTPLLINPLEAVVEYLGPEYPFYFHTLEEAAAKLMDRALIHRTHEYLLRLGRVQELCGENFRRAFIGSGIYRSLPPPCQG